jgi:hypothetical protein
MKALITDTSRSISPKVSNCTTISFSRYPTSTQNEIKIKENKGFCCHLIWNHPYKNLNQG